MQEVRSCLSLGQGHMGSMKSWVDIEEGRESRMYTNFAWCWVWVLWECSVYSSCRLECLEKLLGEKYSDFDTLRNLSLLKVLYRASLTSSSYNLHSLSLMHFFTLAINEAAELHVYLPSTYCKHSYLYIMQPINHPPLFPTLPLSTSKRLYIPLLTGKLFGIPILRHRACYETQTSPAEGKWSH